MDWFYAQHNQQHGPVTLEALVNMLQQGHLQPGDLVWREGMANWQPAGSVPELNAVRAAGDPRVEYFNPVAAQAGAPEYAGFWLRWVAAVLDGILLSMVDIGTHMALFAVPGASLGWPPFYGMFRGGNMLWLIIAWLYFAFMESSQYQATLGKMALGLIVTDLQGQPISFGRASGRFWGKYISYLTLLIGFMMAGWTQQKQALHDMMAGCLVIRKP